MKKRSLKVKNIIILSFIILCFGGGIFFFIKTLKPNDKLDLGDSNKQPELTPSPTITPNQVYTEDQIKKLNALDNIQKKVDYFNIDYLDRYVVYSQKNPTISKEDIITRVNIGLDYDYYTNTKVTPYPNQIYILSNKYVSLGDYIPDDLQTVSSDCSSGTRQLVGVAKVAFENMCHAAKEDGYTIRVMSAYRSYNYQVALYQKYVDQDGVQKADTYSARPGFSEHQTGLVADIDNTSLTFTSFHKTKEYEWMSNHAHKYGFIERYPKGKEDITGYSYESWHYRYVGEEIATYIHEHGITFDEYYVKFIENKK